MEKKETPDLTERGELPGPDTQQPSRGQASSAPGAQERQRLARLSRAEPAKPRRSPRSHASWAGWHGRPRPSRCRRGLCRALP